MKTILVTGANGQLGNSIRRLATGYPHYAFVFTDVDTLDICDAQAVNAFIKEKQVDYIINVPPIRLWIRQRMTNTLPSYQPGCRTELGRGGTYGWGEGDPCFYRLCV